MAIAAVTNLSKLIENGSIKTAFDMQYGFENIPDTVTRLFTGANLGKQLLKIDDFPLPIKPRKTQEILFKIMRSIVTYRKF